MRERIISNKKQLSINGNKKIRIIQLPLGKL
jgi:hypothetical protein